MTLQTVNAIILNCEYGPGSDGYGNYYSCVAKNFQTTFTDRNVSEVTGNHTSGKSNDDVEQVYIFKQSCPFLALNLSSHFKNLKVLYVSTSNVRHLLNGDLDGLTKLKIFDVAHNPIEEFQSDIFNGHESIERVSFYNCHLKIIDPDVLNPLVNLKKAHFDKNACIDSRASSPSIYSNVEPFYELVKKSFELMNE